MKMSMDYSRVKRVSSFEELVETPFSEDVNALCWERELPGDFAEVVAHLEVGVGITALEDAHLRELMPRLSEAGRVAIEVMLEDLHRLRARDLLPELNAVNGYVQREQTGPVRTDVCSFHVDSATVEADTWLCTYHGTTSEALQNEDAVPRITVPETRAALWEFWLSSEDAPSGDVLGQEGATGEASARGEARELFAEWLHENCYDLHYAPLPGARPYAFGVGNLWRVATEWPGCIARPCVHRAPDPVALPGVRLLLIS